MTDREHESLIRTSKERVSDKRLAELVSHYRNVDEQHNGWWVALYWCLRELQERRAAPETCDVQQLRDARYCIGVLLQVAGGRIIIKPSDMINFDSKKEVLTFDDPVSGCRIMELRPPQKAFVQLCAPHGKDWLTCPECAREAEKPAPREWRFDRYRNGRLMAEGVTVHTVTEAEAWEKAESLKRQFQSPTDELRLSQSEGEV